MENFTNTYKRILPLEALANISLVHNICFNCLRNGAVWDVMYDAKKKPHKYLCNAKNEDLDIFINTSIEKCIYSRLTTSIKLLPIPIMMKNKLKIYMKLVLDEMWDWMNYHTYINQIFHQREEGFIINFITDIVWKSDGLIDYLKTALNMISNWRINDTEKFIIMSLYCIEEQLRTISTPIIDGNDWLMKKIRDSELLQYWYNFVEKSNSTSKVFYLTDADLKNVYTTWYFVKNKPLLNEYLEAADLCLIYNSVNQQMAFLSLLNNSQRNTILHTFGYRIIIDCAEEHFFLGRAQSIWMEIKNTITEKHYCNIILKLICYQPYIRNFLKNLWETTPDHLRHTCLDIENGNLLKYLTSYFHASTSDMANRVFFLLQIMTNMTANEKQMVYNKFLNGTKVSRELSQYTERIYKNYSVLHVHNPWIMHKFCNECLLGFEEPVQLRELCKKTYVAKDDCFKLLIEGKYKDLEVYLQCYFVGIDLPTLKIELLSQANDRYQPILQNMILLKKYDCLINAIGYVFTDTILTPDIRMKLFFYNSCFDTWLMAGRIDNIQECINQLFQPENDSIIKKRLAQYYVEDQRFSKLFFSLIKSYQHIDKFLSWCFDEDLDKILEYRSSLNIKGILTSIESEHIREDENCKMSKINDFLLWYFGSQEKVDEFKMNKPDESDLHKFKINEPGESDSREFKINESNESDKLGLPGHNFEIQRLSNDNNKYIGNRTIKAFELLVLIYFCFFQFINVE